MEAAQTPRSTDALLGAAQLASPAVVAAAEPRSLRNGSSGHCGGKEAHQGEEDGGGRGQRGRGARGTGTAHIMLWLYIYTMQGSRQLQV